jgi:hypothetical protein
MPLMPSCVKGAKTMAEVLRPNQTPEPTAAAPSVCGACGRYAAPGLHRCSVSGGYGSAFR